MQIKSQLEKAYEFFCDAERLEHGFTVPEIEKATGYHTNTVQVYISKKWWWFLKMDQGILLCSGLIGYPLEAFIGDHKQKGAGKPPENFVRNIDVINQRKRAIEVLEDMIEANADEAAFQKHLEYNWWMFGTDYNKHFERRRWTRDEQHDFVLRRTVDDRLELIEIKTTLDGSSLFIQDNSHKTLYARKELSIVIGQVMNYLDQLDENRNNILAKDGEDVSHITAKIFIGRTDKDKQQSIALHRLNNYLHGIEIRTFDQLALIARQLV
jgi:Domain of unknown function (DUF4263)